MAEEKKLEQKLVKAVRDISGLALKFVSPGCDGVNHGLILYKNHGQFCTFN